MADNLILSLKTVLPMVILTGVGIFLGKIKLFGKKVIFYVGALCVLRQKSYFTWEKLIKSRQHLT